MQRKSSPSFVLTESVLRRRRFAAAHYNLEDTLTSGQTFRWRNIHGHWTGVVRDHWLQITGDSGGLAVATTHPAPNWPLLKRYFQTEVDIDRITGSFPPDPPLQRAVAACRGLRLLRQDPWECLASFLLSSTKRITQISQIVERLCRHYGTPLPVHAGYPPSWSFPSAATIAERSETQLRELKMGYRAPWLLAAGRTVTNGLLDLESLGRMTVADAERRLIQLPGVGPKIAHCVLLFAYGEPNAFPVDVWINRALKTFYFPGSNPSPAELKSFAARHFAPYPGYAQQYLFHYLRVKTSAETETAARSNPPPTPRPR